VLTQTSGVPNIQGVIGFQSIVRRVQCLACRRQRGVMFTCKQNEAANRARMNANAKK